MYGSHKINYSEKIKNFKFVYIKSVNDINKIKFLKQFESVKSYLSIRQLTNYQEIVESNPKIEKSFFSRIKGLWESIQTPLVLSMIKDTIHMVGEMEDIVS